MSHTEHPSTQLLERNLAHVKQKLLLVNPVELASIEQVISVVPKEKLQVSCQDYGLYQTLVQKHIPGNFQTHYAGRTKFNQAIVFLPKSDLEIEMTLAWVSDALKSNGQVMLIGQNNAGVKSAKKTLEKLIGQVRYTDAARHSALYVAEKNVTHHAFTLENWWKTYGVPLSPSIEDQKNRALTVCTLPGVFSHGKLDEGTALLLSTLTEKTWPGKKILDWGCGGGVIGASLAAAHPDLLVTLADSSALALESARSTIHANKLNNCQVTATNVYSELPETFNFIVANPPFHKGHDTSYTEVEQFLAQTDHHLETHGSTRIVANIFLKYEPLLEQHFGYVKVLAKNNKYKVLEAVKIPRIAAEGRRTKKDKFKRRKMEEEAREEFIEEIEELE